MSRATLYLHRMALRSLALVLLIATSCSTPPQPSRETAKRKTPETITLEARRVPKTLSYVGTLVAPRDATLSSSRGGRVEQYLYEVGQSVRRGDLVVRLGASELSYASQAAVASATQAAVRIGTAHDPSNVPGALAAKATLDSATDATRRAEKLYAQGSFSEQELSRARTTEAAAKAQYDVALSEARAEFGRLKELRALAGQANAALGDKDIRAPFAGVVLDRFVEIGQMAAPNAPLVRLVDPSELRVRFDVPQFDADKVVLGRRVSIMADGKILGATVVRTTPGLVGDGNARLVEAKLGELPEGLLPGARLPAWLEIGEDEELISVPASSTTHTAGISRAWIVEGGHLTERMLSVARFEGDRILIKQGLSAGEELVKTPRDDFRIGEEVSP